MAVAATNKYPNETVDVAFNPVGQVVGQFTRVEKSAAVIERWVQGVPEATNRLNELNEAAARVPTGRLADGVELAPLPQAPLRETGLPAAITQAEHRQTVQGTAPPPASRAWRAHLLHAVQLGRDHPKPVPSGGRSIPMWDGPTR